MKSLLLVMLLWIESILAHGGHAEWQQRDRQDMKPLEYEYQREADVMWSKNIWRTIDVRQKTNLAFANLYEPLIKIIHEAAIGGRIKVYSPAVPDAGQFEQEMSVNEVKQIGRKVDSAMQVNPLTLQEEPLVINTELRWDMITEYRIKEVWFIDTKTSAMKVRIIGLAPVMEYDDADGNRRKMVMYWVYYPALRNILAKHEVCSPENSEAHYSWEDLLEMRKFESYIYKESNVYGRSISEYATGTDAQLESRRIEQELLAKEQGIWAY